MKSSLVMKLWRSDFILIGGNLLEDDLYKYIAECTWLPLSVSDRDSTYVCMYIPMLMKAVAQVVTILSCGFRKISSCLQTDLLSDGCGEILVLPSQLSFPKQLFFGPPLPYSQFCA